MHLAELVATSASVSESAARLAKIAHLADFLQRLSPADVAIAVPFLTGALRQGRIGVGYAALREAMAETAAPSATLTLSEIDAALDRIQQVRGAGSAAERLRQLHALFSRATRDEQAFLVRLMVGE